MSLLFMDGFDVADFSVKWNVTGSGGLSSGVTTRYGRGRSLNFSSAAGMRRMFTPSARVTVGFSARIGTTFVVGFTSAGGTIGHINIRRNASSGLLEVWRGSTLLTTTGKLLTGGSWYFFEMSSTLADVGGEATVRVDGEVVYSFTGDTRFSGTDTLIDSIALGNQSYFNIFTSFILDDLYILNDVGASPTTFLGEIAIQTLLPTGPGSLTEQTPVGSASNWQNVDDVPMNTATYNAATTANKRDLYVATDALPELPIIHAAAMNVIASRTEPGSGSVRTLIRSGGSDHVGSTVPLSTNVDHLATLMTTNPATGAAWTVAELNALEIGSEVI